MRGVAGWVMAVCAAACGRVDFDPRAIAVVDAAVDTLADSAFPACAGNAGTTAPVLVDTGASRFCIDRTEVTAGQYAAFLATGPSLAGQPAACSFNVDFTPSAFTNRWPVAAGNANLPVGSLDWCDARAYCAWAGKRLCGKIGGGVLSDTARGDLTQSEWTYACMMGDPTRAYAYGPSYVSGMCVDKLYPGTNAGAQPVDVGSATACEGGFPGLFDMSGNITEWEDSCMITNTDGFDMCAYRGGEYGHAMGGTGCDVQELFPRHSVDQPTGGFRCCSDAL